ncbi:MAG: glycine cleavage system aminomethyltransferase GcvT [Methanomassiliicoccus sp.]|nr:glycine cleavage system aminomethyltransferase GcvT [Methanomassiliicoccus sp.]
MKRTPLYDAHVALGARIVEFGGWEMPVQYTSILEEHRAVRERAGIFDVSHMGDLIIRGEGAEDSLRELLTNDIKDLPLGKGIYAHVLNEQGKIMDDTFTFRVGLDTYLMVPNASHAEQIYEWVRDRVRDAEVINVSERLACIALQGPKAQEVLQRLTDMDLKGLKRLYGDIVNLKVPSSENSERFLPDLMNCAPLPSGLTQSYVTRSGYTGEDGFEILVESGAAEMVWNALLSVGRDLELRPCGLGARDVLRLEMGYLLSGADFDGTQSTLQTGPAWVIKWSHEFIGREAMLRQKERGAYRKLVGLELLDRGIPRHGYTVMAGRDEIGRVSSGTLSPILNKGIALAYVDADHAREGEELEVMIRDNKVRAVVVKPPFIRRVKD